MTSYEQILLAEFIQLILTDWKKKVSECDDEAIIVVLFLYGACRAPSKNILQLHNFCGDLQPLLDTATPHTFIWLFMFLHTALPSSATLAFHTSFSSVFFPQDFEVASVNPDQ